VHDMGPQETLTLEQPGVEHIIKTFVKTFQ